MSKRREWLLKHVGYKGDECLLWPFSCCTPGYGQLVVDGKNAMAHRYMCILARGQAPSTKHQAAHSCGNRQCVNPRHLSWKTPRQNQLDRPSQGRAFRGRHRFFTPAQVRVIRRLKGKKTSRALAERFGTTESNIRHVQNRTTYQFVTDDVPEQLDDGASK